MDGFQSVDSPRECHAPALDHPQHNTCSNIPRNPFCGPTSNLDLDHLQTVWSRCEPNPNPNPYPVLPLEGARVCAEGPSYTLAVLPSLSSSSSIMKASSSSASSASTSGGGDGDL